MTATTSCPAGNGNDRLVGGDGNDTHSGRSRRRHHDRWARQRHLLRRPRRRHRNGFLMPTFAVLAKSAITLPTFHNAGTDTVYASTSELYAPDLGRKSVRVTGHLLRRHRQFARQRDPGPQRRGHAERPRRPGYPGRTRRTRRAHRRRSCGPIQVQRQNRHRHHRVDPRPHHGLPDRPRSHRSVGNRCPKRDLQCRSHQGGHLRQRCIQLHRQPRTSVAWRGSCTMCT